MGYSSDNHELKLSAGHVRTRTLLIIDDEVVLLELLTDVCRDRGYRVSTATTADQGIEVAIATQPGVILLDVTMPDGTGWGALDRLASHPRTRQIPVVMMSGNPIPHPPPSNARPAALLEKPFTPAELFAILERVLRATHEGQARPDDRT